MQNNDANVIILDTNNSTIIGYGHFHIDLSASKLSFELVYTSNVHQVIIDNSGSPSVTYNMIAGGDKHFIQDTITISPTFTISNISIGTYQTDSISHIDSQPVLITENATGNGNAVPSSDLSGTFANGCVIYADLSSNNSTLTCSLGLNLPVGAYTASFTNKNKKVIYGTQSVNNTGIYIDISFNLTSKNMATIYDDNNIFYFSILDGSTNKLTLPLTDIEFPLPAPGTYHDGYVRIDNSGTSIGYGHFYHFTEHDMNFNSYEIVFTQDISSVTIQDDVTNAVLVTYTDLSGKYYLQDSVLDSNVTFKVITVLPNGTSIESNVADLTEVNSSGNGNGLPLNPDPAATLYPNGCVVYANYLYPTLTYSFGTKLPEPTSGSYVAKFLRAGNLTEQFGSDITVTNNSISNLLTLELTNQQIEDIKNDANLLFCVFDGSNRVVTLQMTDIDFSVVPSTTVPPTTLPVTTTTLPVTTTTTIAPATTTTIAPATTTTIAPISSGYLVTNNTIIYYNSGVSTDVNTWVTQISGNPTAINVYYTSNGTSQPQVNATIPLHSIAAIQYLGIVSSVTLAGTTLTSVPSGAGGGGYGGSFGSEEKGVTCFVQNGTYPNIVVNAAYTIDVSNQYVALTNSDGTKLFSNQLLITNSVVNTIQTHNLTRSSEAQGSDDIYYTIFGPTNITFKINNVILATPTTTTVPPTTVPPTTVPPTTVPPTTVPPTTVPPTTVPPTTVPPTTVPPTTVPPTTVPPTTVPPTTAAPSTLSRGYASLSCGSLIGAAILNLNSGKPSTVSLAYNCSTDISSVYFEVRQNGIDIGNYTSVLTKYLAIDVSLNFVSSPSAIYTIQTVVNLSLVSNEAFTFQGVAGYNIGAGFKSSASPGGVVVASFVPSGVGLALYVIVTFMELYGSGNATSNTITIYFQNTAQTLTVGFPTFTTLGSGTVSFTTSVLTEVEIAAFEANEMNCYIDDEDEDDLHLVTMLVEGLSATPPTPVICFKEGSKILTSTGYVRVEHLVEGHLVQTYKHGLLPIQALGMSRVYNTGKKGGKRDMNALYVYRVQRGGAFADLVVTGKHSALVDSLSPMQQSLMTAHFGSAKQTDGKYHLLACVDARADPYDGRGFFSVYHLALSHRVSNNGNEDGHYGIYANGLLMESCSLAHIQGMAVKLF